MPGQDESLVGAVLGGQYRIVRLLAAGGMGAVYEAEHVRLGHSVAVKVMHPLLSEDDEALVRFEREARAAAALGHPNVVQILDFHRAPGELAWIAMERVHGRSLRELLAAEGALSPDRAVRLALPLLSALEAAHAAGVVHRDLKPGNVMITELPGLGEAPKLVDFGLAKMAEGHGYTRLTRTGLVLGTPAYMAPEQAAGGAVDARTDVYAMGAILYAMLAGRPAFRGSSLGELVVEVATRTPAPLSDSGVAVPPALEAVVRRALAKDPADRFLSARAMAEAIEAATRAAPPPAPVQGRPVETTRAALAPTERALEVTRAPGAPASATPAPPTTQPARIPAAAPSARRSFPLAVVAVVAPLTLIVVVAVVAVASWVAWSAAPASAPAARSPTVVPRPAWKPVAGSPTLTPAPPPPTPGPPRERWGRMHEQVALATSLVHGHPLALGPRLAQIRGECLDRSGTPPATFGCGWTVQFGVETGRAVVRWEEQGPRLTMDSSQLRQGIMAPDEIPDSDALIAELDAHWTCPFRWVKVEISINSNGQSDSIELDGRAEGEGYALYEISRFRNGRVRREFRCYP